MKISRMPGTTEINYEFKKDQAVLLANSDPKDKVTGRWSYDSKKEIILLTTNGQGNSTIIT